MAIACLISATIGVASHQPSRAFPQAVAFGGQIRADKLPPAAGEFRSTVSDTLRSVQDYVSVLAENCSGIALSTTQYDVRRGQSNLEEVSG